MTKPLIALPCTARELENALHAACDHDGLWNAKIRPVFVKPQGDYFLEFYDFETEGKRRSEMTNQERYKTPEERQEAFETFCESQRHDNMPCSKCCELRKHKGKASCAYLWLALKAEEEKPLPCPFCGWDSIDIFETDFGRSDEPYQFAVKCLSCGALVSAEDRGAAIAKWNRRVK